MVISRVLSVFLFLFVFTGTGNSAEEKPDFISIVDAVNLSDQSVIIHAGSDQGVKIGDQFTLSREYYVTGNVVVSELNRTTCKAKALKNTRIDAPLVQVEDKARLLYPDPASNKFNFLLIAVYLVSCVIFWGIYAVISKHLKKYNFENSRLLQTMIKIINGWFWFIFISGCLLIGVATFLTLFVNNLHIQELMVLYFLFWSLMFITLAVAAVFLFIIMFAYRNSR